MIQEKNEEQFNGQPMIMKNWQIQSCVKIEMELVGFEHQFCLDDEEYVHSPIYDDILFGSPTNASNDETDFDVLVRGTTTSDDQFLDIRDKDLFNVASNDQISDNCGIKGSVVSATHDDQHCLKMMIEGCSVDEFYGGGGESEYY